MHGPSKDAHLPCAERNQAGFLNFDLDRAWFLKRRFKANWWLGTGLSPLLESRTHDDRSHPIKSTSLMHRNKNMGKSIILKNSHWWLGPSRRRSIIRLESTRLASCLLQQSAQKHWPPSLVSNLKRILRNKKLKLASLPRAVRPGGPGPRTLWLYTPLNLDHVKLYLTQKLNEFTWVL